MKLRLLVLIVICFTLQITAQQEDQVKIIDVKTIDKLFESWNFNHRLGVSVIVKNDSIRSDKSPTGWATI